MSRAADCRACGEAPRWSARARYCRACVPAARLFAEIGSGRMRAQRMVLAAKRAGTLPSASLLACVDCTSAASDWEHRDYGEPLTVEPVCRGCNLKRGPAKPIGWSFEELLRWAASHRAYRSRYALATFDRLHAKPEVLATMRRHFFSEAA